MAGTAPTGAPNPMIMQNHPMYGNPGSSMMQPDLSLGWNINPGPGLQVPVLPQPGTLAPQEGFTPPTVSGLPAPQLMAPAMLGLPGGFSAQELEWDRESRAGSVKAHVSGLPAPEAAKSDKDFKGVNERVVVPWYFHWDGKKTTDGAEHSRWEYDKNVKDWVDEFTDKRNLGLKLMNALLKPVKAKVRRGGTSVLKEEEGWKELLRRVHRLWDERGDNKKTQMLLDYLKYPKRQTKESAEDHFEDFSEAREKLATAWGKDDPDDMISSEMHGTLLLRKTVPDKKERRSIRRQLPGKVTTKENVEDYISEIMWDDHRSETRKKDRSHTSHRRGDRGGPSSSVSRLPVGAVRAVVKALRLSKPADKLIPEMAPKNPDLVKRTAPDRSRNHREENLMRNRGIAPIRPRSRTVATRRTTMTPRVDLRRPRISRKWNGPSLTPM
jgi:hypothetical protein